jgi:hypothetical protein
VRWPRSSAKPTLHPHGYGHSIAGVRVSWTVALGNALSAPSPVIAVVDVIPTTSVTVLALTLTGIAVTPQPLFWEAKSRRRFHGTQPGSGTIGFGFNTDSAMIRWGALNSGPSAPTFTAPAQTGAVLSENR